MAVAIILAAGSGSRMNSDIAKQYIKINNKEVIYYSLDTFQKNPNIENIVLVTRSEDVDYCKKNIVEKYGFTKVIDVITGGKERYNSVYSGINRIIGNCGSNEIVLIHDSARPLVTGKMIDEIILSADKYGATAVGVPVKDTIKVVDENNIGIETPDRKNLYQIQTPQGFKIGILKEAYEKMLKNEDHNITDDTMLVERYNGVKSKIIMGTYENIKITTAEDIKIAKIFLEKYFKKN